MVIDADHHTVKTSVVVSDLSQYRHSRLSVRSSQDSAWRQSSLDKSVVVCDKVVGGCRVMFEVASRVEGTQAIDWMMETTDTEVN